MSNYWIRKHSSDINTAVRPINFNTNTDIFITMLTNLIELYKEECFSGFFSAHLHDITVRQECA